MADHDEDFAAMFADSERDKPRAKRPKVGDVVSGKVISIGKDAVFVDVGGKAEGTLDRNQVSDSDDKLLIKLGDTVEARVVSDAGGTLRLRIKLQRGPEAKAELVQAAELGIPVEGLVTEVIKGGLSGDVAGVRGVCPGLQVEARFVEDLSGFVGQKLMFRISRYEGRNLVLTRRALLEEDNAKRAVEIRKTLQPGLVVRGKVVGVKPFGAFIDIGGIEGMLHISELGYNRVEKPEDVLSIGQELDVVVLKVEPGTDSKGKVTERISLSLKALANDPWNDATAAISEGMRVKGKITRLQPFGAFVQLAPNVEGLVHVSALGAGRRINHPKEVVEEGQEVEAVVLAVDHERRRISLSMDSASDGTAEDIADVQRAAPSSGAKFGTFGDLLARVKK